MKAPAPVHQIFKMPRMTNRISERDLIFLSQIRDKVSEKIMCNDFNFNALNELVRYQFPHQPGMMAAIISAGFARVKDENIIEMDKNFLFDR